MKCDCLLDYNYMRSIIFFETEAKIYKSYPRRLPVEPVTGVLIIGGVDLVHVT